MSIKSLNDLKELKKQRTKEITAKYVGKGLEASVVSEFFKSQFIHFNHQTNKIEVFFKNKWTPLTTLNNSFGIIKDCLEKVGKFKEFLHDERKTNTIINIILQDTVIFNVEEQDAELGDYVILMRNGIFNSKKRVFEKESDINNLYNFVGIKKALNIEYDEKAEVEPNLEKLLNLLSSSKLPQKTSQDILDSQREIKRKVILGVIGNTLIQKPARMLVNTYGKGGTGKSSFYYLLTSLLGDKATSIDYEALSNGGFESSKLINKTMCYNTESVAFQSDKMIQILKSLSSGGDQINFNIKNGSIGSFRNNAKPFINSNEVIMYKDSGGAVESRLLPLTFNLREEETPYWLTKKEYETLFPNGNLNENAKKYLVKLVVENFIEEKEVKRLNSLLIESEIHKEMIKEISNPIALWLSADDFIRQKIENGTYEIVSKKIYWEFKDWWINIEGNDERFIISIQKFGTKLLEELEEVFKEEGEWSKVRRSSGNYYKFEKK